MLKDFPRSRQNKQNQSILYHNIQSHYNYMVFNIHKSRAFCDGRLRGGAAYREMKMYVSIVLLLSGPS